MERERWKKKDGKIIVQAMCLLHMSVSAFMKHVENIPSARHPGIQLRVFNEVYHCAW